MPDGLAVFPHRDRLIFENNPLIEVICQLRFPTLLRLESEAPAELQERIRERFPELVREMPSLPSKMPDEILKAIGAALPQRGYSFLTRDKVTKVSLSSQSISVSTTTYLTWDEFSDDLDRAFSAFVDIYAPSFFERIGLRYRNVIQRSTLGLEDRPWSELLTASVAGELTDDAISDGITGFQNTIRCKLSEEGDHVNFQHGFVQINDEPETSYLLDFDYHLDGQVECSAAKDIISRLHGYSGNAFQWCISDDLRMALHPRSA
jgi:uncharacterized protein (TIGR04255 family)